MAIPPFPSQELAKLVLGYLFEEQLMTAYDEFLNESPYLDARKNEYDMLMMNSLRNVLAEYRAVRIYVASCKPIALRKKLIQCTNLLEVVKFLVRHVDASKLQADGSCERVSFDSQDVTTSKIGCDACSSLRLGRCMCSRTRNMSSRSIHHAESTDAVESIAQTTSVSDLPGNTDLPEGKHVKVLEPQTIQSTSSSGHSHNASTIAFPMINNENIEQSNLPPSIQIQSNSNIISASTAKANALHASLECSQNIAEFNTVLKEVYNNSAVSGNSRDITENINNLRISAAGTFRDFTTGVGGLAKPSLTVPDSSTAENMDLQLPPATCKESKTETKRTKAQQKKRYSIRIGNVKHDTEISSEVIDLETVVAPPDPKPDEQKVTILSDVRVGNDDRLVRLPPPVLQNATSTPLLQMQTVYINETPIYKPNPPEQKYTFTRDEIMAMPTIILVPAPGQPQTTTLIKPPSVIPQSSCVTTSTGTIASTVQPLTVDVSSNSVNRPNVQTVPSQSAQNTTVGLVKTVEAVKNASVPKDCIVATSCSTSTPQMQPPTRKSSSTPRRTSHVRVLDFTTPRRILSETIHEDPNLEAASNNPTETLISKSPNVSVPHGSMCVSQNVAPNIENNNTNKSIINLTENENSVQNKSVIRKKKDWDADLRALAVSSETVDRPISTPKPKPKPKRITKSADEKGLVKKKNETHSDSSTHKSNVKATATPNRSSKKKAIQSDAKDKKQENNMPMPTPDIPALVCDKCNEKENLGAKQPDKEQNKSNDDDRIDTPEVERLSLQNEIGVKLNISDILETPYKQALYDIQMETPRFLGSDLPGDPMSDIKITNIPTPMFLTVNTPFTPKPAQPTPSSYSSRPTDYSSGGSYYKPDDQDYVPIMEDIICPVTSTLPKETSKATSDNDPDLKESQPKEKEKTKRNKNSRPIRQCTKNVSYYNSPMISKNHDNSKKGDISSSSGTLSETNSLENVTVERAASPRSIKGKSSIKSSNKKNDKKPHGLTKNRSPLKSTQKSFMKIKPRRATPTKEAGKKSRKSSDTIQNAKGNRKNRSTSKDKVAYGPSLVLPVATKSRRKSSTPRKLNCTKMFNSESSGHDSPEANVKESVEKVIRSTGVSCVQDSDTEQQTLRWSDDGSQDSKGQSKDMVTVENDNDEISQIREYIDKTVMSTSSHKEQEGSLHIDLIKRGFDEETAKIIERDLLNSTPCKPDVNPAVVNPAVVNPAVVNPAVVNPALQPSADEVISNKPLERSMESNCSILTNNLVIQEDDDEDEEFSVHECNQDTSNYIHIQHDDTQEPTKCEGSKLRDKFSMEVCIDDGVVVRLSASSCNYLFEEHPLEYSTLLEDNRETENAVSSISNMDRLYTPMKDSIRDQYYQIFDSTLTSIDTPLKSDTPEKRKESVSENVSPEDRKTPEVVEKTEKRENVSSENRNAPEVIEKTEKRKRKRSHGSTASEDSVTQSKRVKQPFTLNSKEIKDLDIEIVLSRLHGP